MTASMQMYAFNLEHRVHFLSKYKNDTCNFEYFFHVIAQIIELLNLSEKNHWSQSKCHQYNMFPETLNTLHCSFENLTNGYCDEALILTRTVFEDFLKLVFLSKYPENIDGLYVNKTEGITHFNATHILESLSAVKNGKCSFFGLLSSFTHGKKPTRLKDYIDRASGKKTTPIQLGRIFDDEEKISFCFSVLTTLQHMLFRSLMVLFAEEMKTTDQFKENFEAFKNDDRNLENLMLSQSRNYTEDIKEMLENVCDLFSGKVSGLS